MNVCQTRPFRGAVGFGTPIGAFAGASKLSPFRANKVFGTSVFFQTVLHGA